MSFSNILTSTKKVGNKYKCRCCQRLMVGNPWMSYNSNGRVKYLCRYLCYKKEREQDNTIWDNLINKEDYEFITPIRNKKESEFVFLNDNDLNRLTESEYIQYNKNMEEYYWKNPERARIREQEIINENYIISL